MSHAALETELVTLCQSALPSWVVVDMRPSPFYREADVNKPELLHLMEQEATRGALPPESNFLVEPEATMVGRVN